MIKKNAGFTLIELVAVMVILAILAVVAIPQFVDLRVQAADASAAGVGGAIASGTALNYARGVATGKDAVQVPGCDAQQLAPLIGGTGSSDTAMTHSGRNYTIAGDPAGLATGASAVCTITDNNGISGVAAQSFTIVGCATAETC